MPKQVKGKATGWIYTLVKQYTEHGAEYTTTQPNGTFNVIFVLANLKDGVIEDITV